MTKLGIIREGKTPPDKRVPLIPSQCWELLETYPELKIYVQPSEIRAIPDSDYETAGLELKEDLSGCDIIIGVKEVPIDMLIDGKTYMFFSHTYKKQPYNRDLLRAILKKNIRLIDYEMLTSVNGRRLIGFGRYAGVVGCYNGLLAAGKKLGLFNLKPAHECEDRREVERELLKVKLPQDFKLVMTGNGRVANGALEILSALKMRQVTPAEFLNEKFDTPVFTQLMVEDYNKTADGSPVDRKSFYADPDGSKSNFMPYATVADMYVSCHYWDSRSPYIFSREDAKKPEFKLKIVADISCDIDGPVASTLRPSTIADPLYGYNSRKEEEVDFNDPEAIGVMAVDNLPCELPKDASEDFGRELVRNIFPALLGEDPDNIIKRATETTPNGELTNEFAYLQGFVDE